MARRIVIAIDGPAGSGKSTVARRLADRLGFRYLDSGAMYRALTVRAVRSRVAVDDESGLAALDAATSIELTGDGVLLDGEDVSGEIRTPEVSRLVSRVATAGAVRSGMVARQRGAYPGEDLVVEGRDIGSVVFPDADVKFFLTASAEERARRRAVDTGQSPEEVLAEIGERDARDTSRANSPLVRAPGAVEVDTTGLTIEEVVQRLARIVHEKTGG